MGGRLGVGVAKGQLAVTGRRRLSWCWPLPPAEGTTGLLERGQGMSTCGLQLGEASRREGGVKGWGPEQGKERDSANYLYMISILLVISASRELVPRAQSSA